MRTVPGLPDRAALRWALEADGMLGSRGRSKGARVLLVAALLVAQGLPQVGSAVAQEEGGASALGAAERAAFIERYLDVFRGEVPLDATPGQHDELSPEDRAAVLDELLEAMKGDPQLTGDFEPSVAGPKLGLSTPEDPLTDREGQPVTRERVEALYRALVQGLVFERTTMFDSMKEALQKVMPESPAPDPASAAPTAEDAAEPPNPLRAELEAEPLAHWANALPDAEPPEGFELATPGDAPLVPEGAAALDWPEPPAPPLPPAAPEPPELPMGFLDAAPPEAWLDPTFRLELPALLRFLAGRTGDPALGLLQPLAELARAELEPLQEQVLEEIPQVAAGLAAIEGASEEVDHALRTLAAPLPLLSGVPEGTLPPEVLEALANVSQQLARLQYRGTFNGQPFEGVVGAPTAVDADGDKVPDYVVDVRFVPRVVDPREGLVRLEARVKVVGGPYLDPSAAEPPALPVLPVLPVPALPAAAPEAPAAAAADGVDFQLRLPSPLDPAAMAGLAPASLAVQAPPGLEAPAEPALPLEDPPLPAVPPLPAPPALPAGPRPIDMVVAFYLPDSDTVAAVAARAPRGADHLEATLPGPGLALDVEASGALGPFELIHALSDGAGLSALGVRGAMGSAVSLEVSGSASSAEGRATLHVEPRKPGAWTVAARNDLGGRSLAVGLSSEKLGSVDHASEAGALRLEAPEGASLAVVRQESGADPSAFLLRSLLLERAAPVTEALLELDEIRVQADAEGATVQALVGEVEGPAYRRATWVEVAGSGEEFALQARDGGVEFSSAQKVAHVRAVASFQSARSLGAVGPGVFRVEDGKVVFHLRDAKSASARLRDGGVALQVGAPGDAPFLVEVVRGSDERRFLLSNLPARASVDIGADSVSVGGSGPVRRVDGVLLRPLDGVLAPPTKTALALLALNGSASFSMAGASLNVFAAGTLADATAVGSNVRLPDGTFAVPPVPSANHLVAQVKDTARQYRAHLTGLAAPLLGFGSLLAVLSGAVGNFSIDLGLEGPVCWKLGNNVSSLQFCLSNIPRRMGFHINLLPHPIVRYEASEKIRELNITLTSPGVGLLFYVKGIPKVVELALAPDGLTLSMDERLEAIGFVAELTNRTSLVKTTLAAGVEDLPETLRFGWGQGGVAPLMAPGDFIGKVVLFLSRPTIGFDLTIEHLPPVRVAWSESRLSLDLSGDRIGSITLHLFLAPGVAEKNLAASLEARGIPGFALSWGAEGGTLSTTDRLDLLRLQAAMGPGTASEIRLKVSVEGVPKIQAGTFDAGGFGLGLIGGGDDPDLRDEDAFQYPNPTGTWNDVVSSLKVPEGCKAVLYESVGFGGASKEFTADAASVGDDFNDKASSLRVSSLGAADCAVTVYEAGDFGGAARTFLSRDDPDLRDADAFQYPNPTGTWDNVISSLRVPPGCKAALYENVAFGGASKEFTADAASVGPDFNDKASSLRVSSLGAHDCAVTVYEAGDFGGASRTFSMAARVDAVRLSLVTPKLTFLAEAEGIPGIAASAGAGGGTLSTTAPLDLLHLLVVTGPSSAPTLRLELRVEGVPKVAGSWGSSGLALGFPGPSDRIALIRLELRAEKLYFLAEAEGIPGFTASWSGASGTGGLTTSGQLGRLELRAVVGPRHANLTLAGPGLALRLLAADVPAIRSAAWDSDSIGLTFLSGKAAQLLLEFVLEAAKDVDDLFLKVDARGVPTLSLQSGASGFRFEAPGGIDSVTAVLRKGTFAYDPAAYEHDFLGAWLRPGTAEVGVSARITGLKDIAWEAFGGNRTQLLGVSFTSDRNLLVFADILTSALVAQAGIFLYKLPASTSLAVRPEGITLQGSRCNPCGETPWLQANVSFGTPAAYEATPEPPWPFETNNPTTCPRRLAWGSVDDTCGISGHGTIEPSTGGIATKWKVYTPLPTSLTLTTSTDGGVPSYTLDTGVNLGKLDLRIDTRLPKASGEDPNLLNNKPGPSWRGDWNDVVSSLRVSPGCTAALYSAIYYGGFERSFTGAAGSVGDINDEASSVKLLPAGAGCSATLYEHANFGGASTTLTTFAAERAHLGDVPRYGNWDDVISSLLVSPGCVAVLSSAIYYGGTSKSFDGGLWGASFASVGSDFDDMASSLRVSGLLCIVTVYEHANFGGDSRIFTFFEQQPDLRAMPRDGNWNNVASSLRVSTGCTATLYDDLHYGGASMSFAAGDHAALVDWWGTSFDDRASSLTVMPSGGAGSCSVTLYEYGNFRGASTTITGSTTTSVMAVATVSNLPKTLTVTETISSAAGSKEMKPSITLRASEPIQKVFLGLRFDGQFQGDAPVELTNSLKPRSGGFPVWLAVSDIPTYVSFKFGKTDWGTDTFTLPEFSYEASDSTLDAMAYIDMKLLWDLLPKSLLQTAVDQGNAPPWLATLAAYDATGHLYLLVNDVPHDGIEIRTEGRKVIVNPAPTHDIPWWCCTPPHYQDGHDHRLTRFFADFEMRWDNSKSDKGCIVCAKVGEVEVALRWYYTVNWYFAIRTLSLLLEDLGYLSVDPGIDTSIDIDGKLLFHYRAGQGANASFGLTFDVNGKDPKCLVCISTPTFSYVIDPGFLSYQKVAVSLPAVTYWYSPVWPFLYEATGTAHGPVGHKFHDHKVAGISGQYPGNWQFDLPIACNVAPCPSGIAFRGLALNYPGFLGPDGYTPGVRELYTAVLDPRLVLCVGDWQSPEAVCKQAGRLFPETFVIAYKAITETKLSLGYWDEHEHHNCLVCI